MPHGRLHLMDTFCLIGLVDFDLDRRECPFLLHRSNLLAPLVGLLLAGFSDSCFAGIPKAPPFVSGFAVAAQASTASIIFSSVSLRAYRKATHIYIYIRTVHEPVAVLVSLRH